LRTLLESSHLSEAQAAALLDTNRWEKATNGIAISPANEFVVGLSQTTKSVLYPALARSAANYPQAHAARFPLDGFDQQLSESGLSPKKLDLVRQQTYTNEGILYLCVDAPL